MKAACRSNVAVSAAWSKLTGRQRQWALLHAGVGERKAEIYFMTDWLDLPSDVKGALLASWQMGAVGATTRRYVKGETTRRMPVLTNAFRRRNPSTKGAYPFAAKEEQYRNYRIEQLLFALKDAARAARAMKGHDPAAEAWYLDDMHTISSEIQRRRARKNQPPVWLTSDDLFRQKFGISIGEWQERFRKLTEGRKREFHRRAGLHSLSAKAVQYVIQESEKMGPRTRRNQRGTQVLPISANKALMTRTVKFLRKHGIKARMFEFPEAPGTFGVRILARHAPLTIMELLQTGPWALDSATELRTPRQIKKWHASAKRHGPKYRPGQYEYSLRSREKQLASEKRNRPRKARRYYVALAKPAYPFKGTRWQAVTDIDALSPSVVGKVAVVTAFSKAEAIKEARKHSGRLGL